MVTAAKSKASKEEIWYVVPEIEVRIHKSWVELICYCQTQLPYGDIKIRVDNACPTTRVKETPNIRFDKRAVTTPKDGAITYLIESLDVRVHEHWVTLIKWCQDYFTKGDIEVRIHNALPTELLSANQIVRFDKPNTIPPGPPLKFEVHK